MYTVVVREPWDLWEILVPITGDPPLSETAQLITAEVEPRPFTVKFAGREGTVLCM